VVRGELQELEQALTEGDTVGSRRALSERALRGTGNDPDSGGAPGQATQKQADREHARTGDDRGQPACRIGLAARGQPVQDLGMSLAEKQDAAGCQVGKGRHK
jgi:hypothetical protein